MLLKHFSTMWWQLKKHSPGVPAGFGLNMGMAFSSYGALQQNSNYAADVMYKPQDTGRRNRVCLEFVWEQKKKK